MAKIMITVGATQDLADENRLAGTAYWWLLHYLQEAGFETSFSIQGSYYLGFEHDKKSYKRFIDSGGELEKTILVRLEPDSVFPSQYSEKVSKKYQLIFSPGSIGAIQKRENLIKHPYLLHIKPTRPAGNEPNLQEWISSNIDQGNFTLEHWKQRNGLVCMVSGNKVSPKTNSNYGLRRKIAKELDPKILDIYGPLWNKRIFEKIHHRIGVAIFAIKNQTLPNIFSVYGNLLMGFSNAKGPVINKQLLIQSYKYSIVVENSQTAVTEKIFDCLINGVLPIYVGPDLAQYGVPEELAYVIHGSAEEILNILLVADDAEIQRKLDAMRRYIQSKHFWDNWPASKVFGGVAQEIIHFIQETEKIRRWQT